MKKDQSGSKLPTLKRRVAYSLAAGAAAGAAGVGAPQAEAAIQYSGLYNINIYQGGFLNLNLDYQAGSPSGDVKMKNYIFGGNYMGASVNYAPGKVVGFSAGFSYASALSAGALIDATTAGPTFFGSMAYGAANPNAQFNNVTDAYLGLSFPSGPNLYYGWIRVDVNQAAGTFVVKDWAYNDVSGAGISAGQVPEPATLGLLAAGSLGLLAMRRRKHAA